MAPPLSARQERANLLDEIRQSGAVDAAWVNAATANFAVWRQAATSVVEPERIQLSDVECYRKGCFTTAQYRSIAEWRGWRAQMPKTWLRDGAWQGGRGVTGPDELPGGQVVSAWVLRIPKSQQHGEN